MQQKLIKIINDMPVLVCSRTGEITWDYQTLQNSMPYDRYEHDLATTKVPLMGGFLLPRKAALL